MRKLFSLLGLAALGFAGSCTEPQGLPDLTGTVVSVQPATTSTNAEVLIRGAYTADPRDMLREFVVHIDGQVYLDRDGAGRLPASAAVIKEGDFLRIWSTGVELQSLPPQLISRIVVIEHH